MNRRLVVLFAAVFTLAIALQAEEEGRRRRPAGDAAAAMQAYDQTGVDLYQKLAAQPGNLAVSPYSIGVALTMTLAGARGETEAEMQRVLHHTLERDARSAANAALAARLLAAGNRDGQKLSIANGLCLTGGGVAPAFQTLLARQYDAQVFGGDLPAINGWVKEKTNGRIEQILAKLSPNTVCVLLNAVYFKGRWAAQFDPKLTADAPFAVSAARQVQVPTMRQVGSFALLQQGGFRALALPYQGGALSLVVILPDAADGLAAVEATLSSDMLHGLVVRSALKPPERVNVMLPRFKLAGPALSLAEPFQALGMKLAFDLGKADFGGMLGRESAVGLLAINQIAHRVFVEVNKEGTEAAAATAVEMHTRAMPQVARFHADHPFLFVIGDTKSGAVLFLGRVTDPTAE